MAQPIDAASLADALANTSSLSFKDDGDRQALLKSMYKAFHALETPIEAALRIAWVESSIFACVRVAVDLNLFEHLNDESGSPKSCAQLADKTGADPMLLGRMLRHMAATGYIAELGADQYDSTAFTRGMVDPAVRDSIGFIFDVGCRPLSDVPEFFQQNKYQNPVGFKYGPFQHGHKTDESIFVFLQNRPEMAASFNNHMTGYARAQPFWTEFYPVQERLLAGFDGNVLENTLMVDIGGNVGHDMQKFVQKYPQAHGRKIVQDLGHVVGSVDDLGHGIEKMEHDFFTEQPVHGARAYFLHSILHDWPDGESLRILNALTPALKKGYSKVLLFENVIPDFDAHYSATGLDWIMLAVTNAMERTEQQWRRLLADSGLKIVGVYSPRGGQGQSIIEAELA